MADSRSVRRASFPEPAGRADACDAHHADALGFVVDFERDVDVIDHP